MILKVVDIATTLLYNKLARLNKPYEKEVITKDGH